MTRQSKARHESTKIVLKKRSQPKVGWAKLSTGAPCSLYTHFISLLFIFIGRRCGDATNAKSNIIFFAKWQKFQTKRKEKIIFRFIFASYFVPSDEFGTNFVSFKWQIELHGNLVDKTTCDSYEQIIARSIFYEISKGDDGSQVKWTQTKSEIEFQIMNL